MRPELTALPAELLGPRRKGASELPDREAGPVTLPAREMGAEAAAVRAAADRDADVTLGLDIAVRAPPASIEGRLVGTGRRPALAADGVCGLAEADAAVDARGRVAVRATVEDTAGVLVLGVTPGLTVCAAATGVLGDPVRLARKLAAAERVEADDTDVRPVIDGLTGDRTPVAGFTGEAVRAKMLAAVGGLEPDAEEVALATLAVLVRRTADGGAEGARLVRGTGALAGVAATLLRGLSRAAAVADSVAATPGRVVLGAGVARGAGSSSTLCISSSGDRT